MGLNQEEEKAIRALKRIEKIWPESLWLFSASGSLCVMKKKFGVKVHCCAGHGEGFDPDYEVDRIAIENDGGDW